jgi:peptidoglycan/LPS O-acetylase OafA/YrhL
VLALALIYVVICLAEWCWLAHRIDNETVNYALPTYTRISAILGGTLCFLGAFLIRRPAPRAIAFAADYSLGLYCLHPFVLMIARRLPLGVLPEAGEKIAQFGFTLALSYAGVYLVRRVIKDFI